MRLLRPLPLLLLAGLSVSLSLNTQAQTVYKITDPDGKVRYSDTRPAESSGRKIEERATPDANQNILNTDPALREWIEQRQQERQESARSNRDAWEQEYQAAKAQLEAAEKALEEGQVLQEGDMVGNRHGGARPSEEFNERVEQLQEAARQARANLDAVNARRPAQPSPTAPAVEK